MWTRKLLVAAIAVGSIGVLPLPAAADFGLWVDTEPPPPRAEEVPPPRAGFVWAPGYWDYREKHHVWVNGHWENDRPGHHYHASHWEHRDGRWGFERGYWSP
jgi:WXXGXW repeat (2 copies)